MSPSTRSLRAERKRRCRSLSGLLLGMAHLALTLSAPAHGNHLPVNAPPLPAAVTDLAEGLTPQGGGEMTFFGLSIYDGWYWAHGHHWSLDAPFALDLHYHRTMGGASIADRSVSEIAHLGIASPDQLARWGAHMRRVFPDVVSGDRITGVFVPPNIVRYFLNGKPIGEIVDGLFARAFFGIWLDPRTSRADFRKQLLGTP
jgi:hypothetical protein